AVMDEILARDGMTISQEARQALRANLGGDRLATRSELEKLALYCRGAREITIEDVNTLTGDVSALSVDSAVDAVLSGDAATFDTTFSRLVSTGSNTYLVLAAAMRQFHQLQA